MNLASKIVIKEKSPDIQEGFEPIVHASQNAWLDNISEMAANIAKVQAENASKIATIKFPTILDSDDII